MAIHDCCASIVPRHLNGCPLYTPAGRCKITAAQLSIVRAALKRHPDSVRVKGNALRSARVLERRSIVEVADGTWNGGWARLTPEGLRLAKLLPAAPEGS